MNLKEAYECAEEMSNDTPIFEYIVEQWGVASCLESIALHANLCGQGNAAQKVVAIEIKSLAKNVRRLLAEAQT